MALGTMINIWKEQHFYSCGATCLKDTLNWRAGWGEKKSFYLLISANLFWRSGGGTTKGGVASLQTEMLQQQTASGLRKQCIVTLSSFEKWQPLLIKSHDIHYPCNVLFICTRWHGSHRATILTTIWAVVSVVMVHAKTYITNHYWVFKADIHSKEN